MLGRAYHRRLEHQLAPLVDQATKTNNRPVCFSYFRLSSLQFRRNIVSLSPALLLGLIGAVAVVEFSFSWVGLLGAQSWWSESVSIGSMSIMLIVARRGTVRSLLVAMTGIR